MTERPILFSGPMVDAIFAGRKTQTRRAVRWPFKDWPLEEELDNLGDMQSLYVRGKAVACPYGIPGDRLWVREAWARTRVHGAEWHVYRAADNRTDYGGPWKPGIHMPRAACRLKLEVTDMRCERLQGITYEDALAEGAADYRPLIESECQDGETPDQCARRLEWPQRSYRQLWDSLNAKRGYGWDKDPWVWVVEFKRA